MKLRVGDVFVTEDMNLVEVIRRESKNLWLVKPGDGSDAYEVNRSGLALKQGKSLIGRVQRISYRATLWLSNGQSYTGVLPVLLPEGMKTHRREDFLRASDWISREVKRNPEMGKNLLSNMDNEDLRIGLRVSLLLMGSVTQPKVTRVRLWTWA